MRIERRDPKRCALPLEDARRGAGKVAAVAALIACCVGLPLQASAQSMSLNPARNFSLGLAATATHWRADCLQTTYCDRSDTGWRLTGAWHFAPQGALELVAADQGRVRAETFAATGGMQSSELRVRGLGLGLAWWMPLTSDWHFVARAGGISNRARFTETADAGASAVESSHRRTDPMMGLGLSWQISPSVTLDGRVDLTSSRLRPESSSLIGGGSTTSHQWGLGVSGYF